MANVTVMDKQEMGITIREAARADSPAIAALDALITGADKSTYWSAMLDRGSGTDQGMQPCFLVAASAAGELVGFILGEIRAWEFGSPPCGWVLALGVAPQLREQGIGTVLLEALCARLQAAGVSTVRTMVRRDDKVNLSFFRGEGLAAGAYIELEKSLDQISEDRA